MKFRNPVLAPLLAVAKARALWQGRGTAPAEVGEQAEVVEELGVWRPFKQEMAHLIEAIACAHAADAVDVEAPCGAALSALSAGGMPPAAKRARRARITPQLSLDEV